MANFDDDNIKFETDLQDHFGFPRGTGIGYMITHAGADGRIKKAAKFKPFVNPATSFADEATRDAARRAALYGLSASPTAATAATPNISITTGILANVDTGFVYHYPRGMSYNPQEWFRSKDFLHYYPDAVFGLKLRLQDEGLYYDGINTAQVHINGGDMPEGYLTYKCLSPLDIFPESYKNKQVGVIVCCPGYSNAYFVPCGATLADYGSGGVHWALFAGQNIPGVSAYYAIIPDLAGNWKNKAVTIAAALGPESASDQDVAYKIDVTYPQSSFYSFEFERGIDRLSRVCTNNPGHQDMDKLSCTMTQTPSGTKTVQGDYVYFSSLSNLNLRVVAENGFSGDGVTLYAKVTINVQPGAFTNAVGGEFNGNIEITSQYATFKTGNTWNISHAFSSIPARQVAKCVKSGMNTGKLLISLVLSTNSDGSGATKSFNFEVTLGTW